MSLSKDYLATMDQDPYIYEQFLPDRMWLMIVSHQPALVSNNTTQLLRSSSSARSVLSITFLLI
jgi:hypothetical protein